jgi:Domain of unknown function (DUF4326)
MEVVNVSVRNIRPTYKNLEEWIKDSSHEYIGDAGKVIIGGKRFPRKGSNWGNPFPEKKYGSEYLILYEKWVRTKIKEEGIESLLQLKGKKLGCWCAPNKCHGDILKKVVEECKIDFM